MEDVNDELQNLQYNEEKIEAVLKKCSSVKDDEVKRFEHIRKSIDNLLPRELSRQYEYMVDTLQNTFDEQIDGTIETIQKQKRKYEILSKYSMY
jgi:hypothetical protein